MADEEVGEPARAEVRTHQCCCVVISGAGENPCVNLVVGSDNPFCAPCERRHPEQHFVGVEITARLR